VLEALVVGAGPGGLAAAAELKRRRIAAPVVDRAEKVGSSWRGHYDRLHLHTVRWLSHLPGYPIPREYGRWVARDDVVRYLEDYARHFDLDVRLGVSVERIDRAAGGGWTVFTSEGPLATRTVVVATGYNHTPALPDWNDVETFTGELLHASRYRNARPFRDRDVLVVGSGNTGAEIAVDLVEGGARRVRIAVRTPPHVVVRDAGGLPAQVVSTAVRHLPVRLADSLLGTISKLTVGDLTQYGLTRPAKGIYSRILQDAAVPIIDVGFLDRLKNGQITVVAAVVGFAGDEVCLADGTSIEPDVVIAATGYGQALEQLVGHLGVLGPNGRPRVTGGRTAAEAPGLYFTGYTNPISGMFRELNLDARRIARHIAANAGAEPAAPTRVAQRVLSLRRGAG
jgi:putative flavoprotein involved in K+ transport